MSLRELSPSYAATSSAATKRPHPPSTHIPEMSAGLKSFIVQINPIYFAWML
jgi:hypothetical protein